MIWLISSIGVVVTAVISGLFGMAGGVLLIWLLLLLFSVPATMVLHGAVQLVSNGYRCWLLRGQVYWPAILPFCLGGSVALGLLLALQFQPDRAVVLIVVGLAPLLSEATRSLIRWRIEHRPTAVVGGFVSTLTQIIGVSGPLLDLFYTHTNLNRYQVVASKAFTQSLGHLIKIGYWLTVAEWTSWQDEVSWYGLALLLGCAAVGTFVGRSLLDKISDHNFRRHTRWLVVALGLLCLGQGVYEIFIR